jgi:hypothetical protein
MTRSPRYGSLRIRAAWGLGADLDIDVAKQQGADRELVPNEPRAR